MTIDIEKILEEAEPVEAKGIGKMLGYVNLPPVPGDMPESANVFERNVVLFRYRSGLWNVFVMTACVATHKDELLLIETDQEQNLYSLFEKPVSEEEARRAYNNLNRLQ